MSDVKEISSFLTDLSENNNKGWFHVNRQRYTDAQKMAEALCAELIEGIRGFDPNVGTLSSQDCLFRILRDTRFAKDKSPYRPGFGMFVAVERLVDIYQTARPFVSYINRAIDYNDEQ